MDGNTSCSLTFFRLDREFFSRAGFHHGIDKGYELISPRRECDQEQSHSTRKLVLAIRYDDVVSDDDQDQDHHDDKVDQIH